MVANVPPIVKENLAQATGAFLVTWSHPDGTVIDSEWLTREEYHDMLTWIRANGWDHTAKYVQRAQLSPEALARLIKDY